MADDESLAYTYGGRRWVPVPWSSTMRELKAAVEAECGDGVSFNSCLLNLYRDGSDHVPWHADDESVYGDLSDCTIASVSLGATRLFQIREAPESGSGTARAAEGETQAQRWKYQSVCGLTAPSAASL